MKNQNYFVCGGIAILVILAIIFSANGDKSNESKPLTPSVELEGDPNKLLGPDGIELQSEADREALVIGSPNAGQGETLYSAFNKLEDNSLLLFDAVFTNTPPNLTLNSPIISDGTSTATAAQVVAAATGGGSVVATNVSVSATPSSYSASAAEVEAHLVGIDTAIGALEGSDIAITDSGSLYSGTNAESALQEVGTDTANLRTLSGTSDGTTNLGTFTGSTIADSSSVKTALQSLETFTETRGDFEADGSVTATGNFNLGNFQITNVGNIDGRDVSIDGSNLDSLQTLSGISAGSSNLGSFTGDIISDNTTVKTALQQVETDVDAIQSLSGVADASTNLGTFSGDIISDSSTVKTALQEVETDLDAMQTASGIADAVTNYGTFTGDTISDNGNLKTVLQELETGVEDSTSEQEFRDWSNRDEVGKKAGYRINSGGTISFPAASANFGGNKFTVLFDIDDSNLTSTFLYKTAGSGNDRLFFMYQSGSYTAEINESGGINPLVSYTTSKLGRSRWVVTVDLDDEIKLYRNGILIDTNDTISANDFSLSSPSTHQYETSEGLIVYGHKIFNRTLTEAEVIALSSGHVSYADLEHADGSASYTSNFLVDVNGWTSVTNGTLDANIDHGGETNVARFTINTANSTHNFAQGGLTTAGKRNRATFRYFMPSSNSHVNGFTFGGDSTEVETLVNVVTDTWTTYAVTYIADSTALRIKMEASGVESFQDLGGDDVFYITDIEVTPVGEVLSLTESSVGQDQWVDQSGNGHHGSLTSVTPFGIKLYDEVAAESFLKVGSIWIRDNAGTPEYSNDSGASWNAL